MSAPFIRTALLAGVATAVTLLVVEFALHLFAARPIITTEWILEDRGLLNEHAIFVNPAFRSDSYYEIDDSLATVVALGDSFTAGHPVDDKDSYPAVLEGLLADADMEVNLIDMGMGDTGPDQHLRIFEREVLSRVSPTIVIWQFYPNDEWDNVVKAVYTIADDRLVPLDASRNWLYRRQVFYDRVPFRETLRRGSYLFRYLLKVPELWRTAAVPRKHAKQPMPWGLSKIALTIERLNELGANHGFRPYYVLVAPEAFYVSEQPDGPDPPASDGFVLSYERLFEVVQDESGFIDARFYEGSGTTLSDDVFIDDGRDPLPRGGRHFNEKGYRLLAELIFDRLRADNAIVRRDVPPK